MIRINLLPRERVRRPTVAPRVLVWLIRIDARGDGNLTFNGFGMSYEAVARFMVNLDGSPLFQGADLTIGQKQNQAGHDVINFSVTASLTPRQKEVGVR